MVFDLNDSLSVMGIYSPKFNKNRNRAIHEGLNIVGSSFSSTLLSAKERRENIANKNKDDVLTFIRKNRNVTINEVMDKFNMPFDTALATLQKLAKENKINLV